VPCLILTLGEALVVERLQGRQRRKLGHEPASEIISSNASLCPVIMCWLAHCVGVYFDLSLNRIIVIDSAVRRQGLEESDA